MSEETKVEVAEQQQQADASRAIIDGILNVGKPKEVGKAPEPVKPDTKTPETATAQSPAKETVEAGKTDEKTVKTDNVEDVPKIDLAEIANEVFGIPKPQEETIESLKQKYAHSSKEALKKHAELKELQEFLKANNLEIVRDGEGKPVLTVPKDYEDKFDINQELQGLKGLRLSEEQIDKLVENPDNQEEILNGLYKKVLLSQQAKRPAVKSRPAEQPLLSDDDKHNVFAEFVNAKNRVGSPMFPDAANEKIIPIYQMLHNAETPDMRALREVAERNADVHGAYLKLLYFQAKDIMRIAEAKEAEARKRIEESKKKLNESVIPTAGDAITPSSTMQKTGGTYEDSIKNSILGI